MPKREYYAEWKRRQRQQWKSPNRAGERHVTKALDIPLTVANERMIAYGGNLNPEQIVLGDPPPGRSALDKLRAKQNAVFSI